MQEFAPRTAALLAAMLCASVHAASPAEADREAAARALAERAFVGKTADVVRRLPDLPFYEVWIDHTLVYTDLDAKALVVGNILDGATLKSLRDARIAELSALPMKELPLQGALKTVRGNGRARIVVFADPNCGYCKRYEEELAKLDDVTIQTVVYPVLGPDSLVKARAILCAPQPEKAWHAWMRDKVPPTEPAEKCKPAFEVLTAFGLKNNIKITPTTFLASGKRLVGIMPAETLRKEIAGAPAGR